MSTNKVLRLTWNFWRKLREELSLKDNFESFEDNDQKSLKMEVT